MDRCTLGVLASGRGSGFQSIIDHIRLKVLQNVEICVLVCNKADAYALRRAKHHGIEGRFIDHQGREREDFDREVVDVLSDFEVDLVVLAGFMRILSPYFVEAYRWRIMNIHPGDPRKYGGRGMIGEKVHEAVLRTGEIETMCVVHFVDYGVDTGPIILEQAVPVKDGDTPQTLAERVLIWEHRIYAKAIQLYADGRLEIKDGKVKVNYNREWMEQWNIKQRTYVEYQSEYWRRRGRPLEEVL
ncbi:MAG: phosphoribosylglycinamide formyltransferase [Nitrososphaeria archaeon]|nr:phosphoribosylglycinamide formyltransferase [Nitrososphaeria archaeon]NIN52989.1 phosphoribosylglycinamide formyltransferase [Nitrososphaeria archaeon]NIQ33548.1 phosphoribosylglycinamide formyltransferase [Nitrososphaeria archaeon]